TRIGDMKARHTKVRALIGEGKSRDEIVASFSLCESFVEDSRPRLSSLHGALSHRAGAIS
ncbi:MAG: hypothetical protein P8168_14565, partial [Deltaproteobacteria bacterium]